MPTGWMWLFVNWQFNITCSGFFSHHLKCFQPLGASPERQSSLCQCWAAFTLSLSCLCGSCLIQVPWLCRRDTPNLWLFQWRKWRFGLSHGFLGHPIFWQTHILLSFSFSPYPAIGVHFDQENTFDIVDQSEVGDIPLRAPRRKNTMAYPGNPSSCRCLQVPALLPSAKHDWGRHLQCLTAHH